MAIRQKPIANIAANFCGARLMKRYPTLTREQFWVKRNVLYYDNPDLPAPKDLEFGPPIVKPSPAVAIAAVKNNTSTPAQRATVLKYLVEKIGL